MKKTRMIPCILALVFILGIYGMAFAGGGGPDPGACDTVWACYGGPPPADAGKFLRGEYTVSKEGGVYVVHIRLKWGNQEQMYSFNTSSIVHDGLCSLTAEQLKERFEVAPCGLIITEPSTNPDFVGLLKEKDFADYILIPVLTDLTIEKKYNCGLDYAMIRGEVVVRVVPIPFDFADTVCPTE